MKLKVCSIRDRASNLYSQPFYTPTTSTAIRSFQDAINDPKNNMGQHADDYDLYLLGEYNDETGQFTNEEQPQQIAIGKQLYTGA